jgi:hypothetical protein
MSEVKSAKLGFTLAFLTALYISQMLDLPIGASLGNFKDDFDISKSITVA